MAKIRKMKFLPVLDITLTGFFIGQAIGRWGNFFNQEVFATPPSASSHGQRELASRSASVFYMNPYGARSALAIRN